MARRSPEIDSIHAGLPPKVRKALEAIRRAVHSAAPGAEECLAYGMPAVRLDGKPLVAWRAAAKHGAFHPLSGQTVAECAAALVGYDTSKGTIRFPLETGLPAALVKLLVAARIAEQARLAAPEGKALPKAVAARRGGAPAKRVRAKGTGARPAGGKRPERKTTRRQG